VQTQAIVEFDWLSLAGLTTMGSGGERRVP